jgi:phosphopentomutase
VGRVIARPYLGHTADTFRRTTNRHDLSLKPPRATMLDVLKAAGKDVIAVGKISDIFDGEGVTEKIKTTGNTNGIAFTKALQTRDFEGLAFVNLVDFDMLYGHRRDVAGYAAAATEFDAFLADFIPGMREDDLLMVTADHGCDPSYTKTTDHTREYVPYLVCGKPVRAGANLGTRLCFGAIAKTICEYLGVENQLDGTSVLRDILK